MPGDEREVQCSVCHKKYKIHGLIAKLLNSREKEGPVAFYGVCPDCTKERSKRVQNA
jgi:uncharacterized protein YlaI